MSSLPDDHFSVFKAATSYSYVNRDDVYRRLGYIVPVPKKGGSVSYKYSVPWRDIPKQLCSPTEFRSKIAGVGSANSLIKKNLKSYGIAQGLPISDLIANFSLIEFDIAINKWISSLGGVYMRYSDDIIIIAPYSVGVVEEAIERCKSEISNIGSKLRIKDEKTLVRRFQLSLDGRIMCFEPDGAGWKKSRGIEYLGFRFDGMKVYIRDATLSNLWRKVSRSAAGIAANSRRRFVGKTDGEIWDLVDKEAFLRRFGRVEDFEEKANCPQEWTFWTYARRSSELFGSQGKPIMGQMRRFRVKALAKLNKAIMR